MEQLKIFGLVSEKKNTADRDIDRQVGGGGGVPAERDESLF